MKRIPSIALLSLSVLSGACKLDWDENRQPMSDGGPESDGAMPELDGGPDGAVGDGGDGDGGTRCLRDQDGDGYGVEGVVIACSGADPVEPGDCDDEDPLAYPGAARVLCDTVDNDCDGVAEESADETCNFIDDDCDGVADPNLASKLDAAGQHVHVQAGGGSPLVQAQVALLARPGGAWLLSVGQPASPDQGHAIAARALDAQGLADATQAPETLLSGATRFAADSDGKWVVVLARMRPTASQPQNDSNALRLQLFKADDLSLVGDQVLMNHVDDDDAVGERDDRGDCDDVEPLHVAVQQSASGDVHIVAASFKRQGVMNGSSCSSNVLANLNFLTYSTSTGWRLPSDERLDASSENLLVHRVPCRNEWVVAHGFSWANPGWLLHVFGIDGQPVRPAFPGLGDVEHVTALAHEPESCEAGEGTLVLAYAGSAGAKAQRWSVSAETGAMAPRGDAIVVSSSMGRPTRLAHAGGRWFAAGHDAPVLAGSNTAPRFWELSFAAAESPARELPLFAAVRPGEYNPGATRAAVLALPGAIVAAYAASPRVGNLQDHREPGVTDPAVAATYRIGCN